MALTILLLLLFTFILLIYGWKNRYFLFFALLVLASALSMFTLTVEVAKVSNYLVPAQNLVRPLETRLYVLFRDWARIPLSTLMILRNAGIVAYLGVCDGNMEEGNFRCDANVSIRPRGQKELGTRTELKNVNSFRNVARAIDYEIARQSDILDDGGSIRQETRLYDADKNVTAGMRGKEEAHDYRYFPDPDQLPVVIADETLAAWKAELPELPAARLKRFLEMTKLPLEEAEVLVESRAMADFFEEAARSANPRKVANYILGPLLRELKASGKPVAECGLSAAALAELVNIVDGGLISAKIANDIFPDLMKEGAMPKAYVEAKGLAQVSDSGVIDQAVDKVIAANPAEVEAYKGGKTKLLSFFMGQVMRETKGKANPGMVSGLLKKKLGG